MSHAANVEPLRYIFLDCEELLEKPAWEGPATEGPGFSSTLAARLGCGLQGMQTVRVEHSYPAYALILQGNGTATDTGKSWKVAYSGDTRPHAAFAEAARGSDVLIHEATHEDCLLCKAKSDRHTTVGEALELSGQAEALYTILTHFSSRYQAEVPRLEAYMQPIETEVDTTSPQAVPQEASSTSSSKTVTESNQAVSSKPTEHWVAKDVSRAASMAACAVDMLCVRFTDLQRLHAASLEMSKVTREEDAL